MLMMNTNNNDGSVNLDINNSFQGSARGSRQSSRKGRKSPKKATFGHLPSPGKPSNVRPDVRHKRDAL